jgi:hypothetical protein
VDKPALDKFRDNGRSRLEVDWLFFAQETTLLKRKSLAAARLAQALYGTDFLLGHYQMSFELDHCFIWTEVGAPEADLLIEFGLTEGQPNTHPGQGTANRRFFFENVMLELLWVHNKTEAQSNPIQETRLWERWCGRRSEAPPLVFVCGQSRKTPRRCPFPAGPIARPTCQSLGRFTWARTPWW